jgi:hypothetical protein
MINSADRDDAAAPLNLAGKWTRDCYRFSKLSVVQ